MLFDTIAVPSPVALRHPAGHTTETWLKHCFDEATRLIGKHHEHVAGFVIEPLVQGAAGILIHPDGYLRHIRDLCTRFSIPLIADEVAVGFGRTGTMFACNQESVRPDIMCVAKGITGGYLPLAATITTDEIYEMFLGRPEEGRTFFHGHTYTGNPLACAASIASLELFEENQVIDNVKVISDLIADKLSVLAGHSHVAEVRQKGIMIGIELVRDRETLESVPAEDRIGHQVTLAARRAGVIIRPLGDVVVLMPAPGMPARLVERLCDVTIQAIDEVTT